MVLTETSLESFDLMMISMIFRGSSRSLVIVKKMFEEKITPRNFKLEFKRGIFFILMNFDFVMISNMSLF